ncbi:MULTISPECIES: hypothetical protein [Lactococcus]|uniref:Uncharacterized protein n=1 Tax=Lactococcus fujiensis JCM 16395 TaxID=1291764 RepID=A0A2A5RIB2_9LACT|nr:hypothetical protein [Lactococcus fujiensis]PCR98850.1 hypothetical protein RT41_GL000634 [Lactococcus fujiensis JCM 16395]
MESLKVFPGNIQIFKITQDDESSLPKSKATVIAFAMIALSSLTFSANLSQGLHFVSSKNKTNFSKIIDNSDKKTRSVNLSKKEGEASMSEVKLNEVQKYFDDKISNVKENIHNIDKRLSVMENELGHLSKSLESIPEVIESSVRLTLDKIEKEKKVKWWDRYGGPIITGVIVAIITVGGPFLLKLLKIIK